MKRVAFVAILGLALVSSKAKAEDSSPAQVQKGAELFALNCATCHGTRMRNPQWAIDLRTFPKDAKPRFIDSVMNGNRNMPPWDDVLKNEEVEALWAYVSSGDRD